MTILVIAEHDNVSIGAATLNTVGAAALIATFTSHDVHILVIGPNAHGAAEAAARIAGVSKVLLANAPKPADYLAEEVEATVLAVARCYTHILAPATAYGRSIAPQIAARLNVAQISEITAVDSGDTFECPIYADKAIEIVQSSDPIKVITVRTEGFEPGSAQGGCATVERMEVASHVGLTRVLNSEVRNWARPELS